MVPAFFASLVAACSAPALCTGRCPKGSRLYDLLRAHLTADLIEMTFGNLFGETAQPDSVPSVGFGHHRLKSEPTNISKALQYVCLAAVVPELESGLRCRILHLQLKARL